MTNEARRPGWRLQDEEPVIEPPFALGELTADAHRDLARYRRWARTVPGEDPYETSRKVLQRLRLAPVGNGDAALYPFQQEVTISVHLNCDGTITRTCTLEGLVDTEPQATLLPVTFEVSRIERETVTLEQIDAAGQPITGKVLGFDARRTVTVARAGDFARVQPGDRFVLVPAPHVS